MPEHHGRNQQFFLCKNGVFNINRRSGNARPIQFQTGELLIRLISLEQELLLLGSQRVYRYDEGEETFHPLPQNLKTKLMTESELIIPVSQNEYWILNDHGMGRSRIVHTTSLEDPGAVQASFPACLHLC